MNIGTRSQRTFLRIILAPMWVLWVWISLCATFVLKQKLRKNYSFFVVFFHLYL